MLPNARARQTSSVDQPSEQGGAAMNGTKTIYLAGPISNCNEKQRTAWRRAITSKLKQSGHTVEDPADHMENWTPFTEMVQIDKSDVVIANLWRESIGTVVGIVQARRKGKPVILIDPNYIDSSVLRTLVGADRIVRSLEDAVRKLESEVVPELSKKVFVRKKLQDQAEPQDQVEPFDFVKLHDALIAVCAEAHIQDAVLPELVAHEVYRALMRDAGATNEITTDQIKRRVFVQLSDIIKDELYEDELRERADKLRRKWEEYERVKKDQRVALQLLSEADHKLGAMTEESAGLRERLKQVEYQNSRLQEQLQLQKRFGEGLSDADAEEAPECVLTNIQRFLGGRRALCLLSEEATSFSEAFARHGISKGNFEDLFEERRVIPKSTLVHDVDRWVGTYPAVLYAFHGLRHLESRRLKAASNLFSGPTPLDVVKQFAEHVGRIVTGERS